MLVPAQVLALALPGNVYSIAYIGSGSDGFLKTFERGTDGQITDTVIDTLEISTSGGKDLFVV